MHKMHTNATTTLTCIPETQKNMKTRLKKTTKYIFTIDILRITLVESQRRHVRHDRQP